MTLAQGEAGKHKAVAVQAEASQATTKQGTKRARDSAAFQTDRHLEPIDIDIDIDNRSNMVLLTNAANNHAHKTKALAKALLQVASLNRSSSNSSSSIRTRTCVKIIESLERTLADQRSNSVKAKRSVHVVEYPADQGCAERIPTTTIMNGADHIVLILSASDIAGTSTQTASNRKSKTTQPLWDHPLVQQGLSHLPACGILDANCQDPVSRHHRTTIVLLATQEEEDNTTLQVLETATGKKKTSAASTTTSHNPTIFLCRPNDPISCHSVARMLWRRLELGKSSQVSPLLFF